MKRVSTWSIKAWSILWSSLERLIASHWILLSTLASILIGIIGMILKTRGRDTPMAFGPFLAIAGWATLFLGPNIF